MIKLTQKELDVLGKVGSHVKTEEKPYFTTNTANKAVIELQKLGLVETRQSGITVEVVLSSLGVRVLNNEVEHEIVMSKETPTFENTANPHALAAAPVAVAGDFVLEDNVPMPVVKRQSNRPVPYPLAEMQVGQSFFVQATPDVTDLAKYRSNISSKVSQCKRRLGLESAFTVGVDLERNGVRVWRKA